MNDNLQFLCTKLLCKTEEIRKKENLPENVDFNFKSCKDSY